MRIFVYGTLMRGGCRATALRGQSFLGETSTQPHYLLYDCGTYPGLVDRTEGVCVHGEVWEVDAPCLATLDRVERVAQGLYERRPVKLNPPFDEQRVEAYFYRPSTAGMRDCGARWTNSGRG